MMSLLHRLLSRAAVVALVLGGLITAAPAAQASEEVYPAPASGAWTVDGRAFGHGRGMAQWGAQAQALQGRTSADILGFYYPGTTATGIANPFVKVTLAAYAPTTTVTIWSPAGSPAAPQVRIGPLAGETLRAAGRWTITVVGTQVTAQRRDVVDGPVLETVTVDGVLRLESLAEYGMVVAGAQTATTGRWYRGDLRIEPTSGAGFNVTNSLPMEDYLRSVVPRESPASWQPAALEAQAVAARSYAWYKITNGSTLCDTTACQVYYGRAAANAAGTSTQSYEDPRTNAAITATAGQVRSYGGAVAMTEFSSSNGGWTSAGPASLPYQVAKEDPWIGTAPGDTVTAWSTTLAVSQVAQSCPGGGGTVRNLVVVARTGNGLLGGRVTQARVECSTGNATVYSPAFGLRSSWWKPRPAGTLLDQPAQSATVIDNGAQMSLAATPSVAVTWTLTVRDRRTGRVVVTRSGAADAGERFNATWFGSYEPRSMADPPYVGAGVYDLELAAVDGAGTAAAPYRTSVQVRSAPDPVLVPAVPLVGNAGYVAVTPARLLDSRPNFQSVGPGQRVDLQVTGLAGVPTGAVSAVVLNVTAVGATEETHLRVWPAGSPMPNASVLNTGPRTQASLVTVGVGGAGKVSLYNAAGTTNYLVDVLGYYTTALASSSRYTSVTPVRVFDSRATGGALADGTARQVDVAAGLGLPAAGLVGAAVNITTTQAQGDGYVVAYGGGAVPGTSSVNLTVGADVANRSVVPVIDGKVTVAVKGGPSQLIVDVVGWYAPAGTGAGDVYTPIQPTRVLDTRVAGAGTPFGPAETRSVVATGGAVPAGATTIVGTLTATGQTATSTHARVWPAGLPLTATSDLNSGRGRTQANAVLPRVGGGGAVLLYNDQGSSDLILDVVGYFG